MKRLRKSEIKELSEKLPIELNKKDDVQLDDHAVLINGELAFFKHAEMYIPSLRLVMKQDLLPRVVVDMGAVRFVTRGANVMRPGITEIGDFDKGDAVVVVDETHKKPLMVGIAMLSGDEMKAADSGHVVESLHYVGDELWNQYS